MPVETPLPDIVQYAEYRLYLKDRYQAMRQRDRKFSHRYIASKAGGRSAGWFADLVAGRQKLPLRLVKSLAATFRMDARETSFLESLVSLEEADSPEARIDAMEKWRALKGIRSEAVDKDRFAFFDHWYHIALRELLGFRPFDGDYSALGAALQPPVGAARVKEAIDLLQRLGLIQPQVWNRRSEDLPVLIKAPDIGTGHWSRIVKDLSKLAAPALESVPKEDRNFSAVTLSLSPDGLKKAGEEIAQLRKRLLLIADKDKARNRVFQFLFQVFPLSKPWEPNRE